MSLTATIKREYIYITTIARTLWLLRLVKPNATRNIVDIVEGQARSRPGNAALLYLDQTMTYAQLDARANRYAHWALSAGIGRGDADHPRPGGCVPAVHEPTAGAGDQAARLQDPGD